MRATNHRASNGSELARRLATLRQSTWPDLTITQRQLGKAIGRDRALSAPTISSWESPTNPRSPNPEQLAAYARFFATRRSASEGLLPDAALTGAEIDTRRRLKAELIALHPTGSTATVDPLGEIWQLADDRPVTIVCSDVAADIREAIPRADPTDPDYIELYSFAELDALVEIFGHIRAANPTTEVTFRSASTLRPDDFTTHLVVLGSSERNELSRDLQAHLDMPVRQVPDKKAFQPTALHDPPLFRPKVDDGVLVEDVAHFYRTTNPFNIKRTLTLCSAVFNRGVLGAVRALTDARFRNRNESYVQENFASRWSFSILMRVPIVSGLTVTPDWTAPETLLHTWPPPN